MLPGTHTDYTAFWTCTALNNFNTNNESKKEISSWQRVDSTIKLIGVVSTKVRPKTKNNFASGRVDPVTTQTSSGVFVSGTTERWLAPPRKNKDKSNIYVKHCIIMCSWHRIRCVAVLFYTHPLPPTPPASTQTCYGEGANENSAGSPGRLVAEGLSKVTFRGTCYSVDRARTPASSNEAVDLVVCLRLFFSRGGYCFGNVTLDVSTRIMKK